MARGVLDRERKFAVIFQFITYVLLTAAMVAFFVTYLRYRPSTDLPVWLAYGFPIAICIAILHFGRRAFISWKHFKSS